MKRTDLQTIAPRARKKALLVRDLSDEVLVYDLLRVKAHCLNHTAASIWRQCNGRRTVEEIALKAGRELDTPVSTDAVWLALSQLEKIHLLDGRVAKPAGAPQVSRRDLMRLGVAGALAIPVIMSMAAPSPVHAQSCKANGTACNNGVNLATSCCTGCCLRASFAAAGTCSANSGTGGSNRAGGVACSNNNNCCSQSCVAGICAF